MANDQMAAGAHVAALAAGLRVPDDISIVGFDDVPLAETMTTPLTTSKQELSAIASLAVDLLLEILEDPNKQATELVSEVELVERESAKRHES